MDPSFICGSFGNVVEGCLYSPQGSPGRSQVCVQHLDQSTNLTSKHFSVQTKSKRHWGNIKCKRPHQELTNLKFSQFNIHAWLVERYSCFVFVYLFVYLYFTPWPINNSCDLWKFLSSTLLNSRLAGWLAGCWNISTFQNICRRHQQECLNWFKLVLETSFKKPPKILIPWLTDCVCYEIFFYGFKHHVSRGLSARRTIRTKSSLGSSGRSP